jgi:DNA-3-methyladenine glycosylase
VVSEPLPRRLYARPVVRVARELLSKRLIRTSAEGVTAGRIVEVEAYLARDDPANHAHRGQTRRNASMFGPPGHAYVYAIHARFCLNVVTEPAGVPSAVLIRAVEPLEGIELMQQRRGTTDLTNLARGPARLCEAFAIDRTLDGWDLTRGERLWLASDADPPREPARIATAARVGVTAARDLQLRFFRDGNPFVSRLPRARRTDSPAKRQRTARKR